MAGDKACKCVREINHVDSMNLMLMESIADKRWDSAETYRKIVGEAIEDVGKCAGVDVSAALEPIKRAKEYIEKKEVRLPMRTLQDAFWLMLAKVCYEEL